MAKSRAFALIRADVLAIVAALPHGRLTTFAAIGEYMHVATRHVAYLLAGLTPFERDELPWHRVVGANGELRRRRYDNRGRSQAELLGDEGVQVVDGRVVDFDALLVDVGTLESGVRPGRRYDAPD